MTDEVFVSEEGSEVEDNPGNEDQVNESIEALQEEVRELREKVDSEAPEENIDELSEGERVLELRARLRELDGELKLLRGEDRGIFDFTEKTDEEEVEERKLVLLLEGERKKAAEELSEIIAAVTDVEPEEAEDKWSQ